MRTYVGYISRELLGLNGVLVFGSNTQGKHGKGTAKLALLEFDAKYGQAKGLQGRSYGIVTKDLTKNTHPSISKEYIIEQITNLYYFAIDRNELDFYIPYTADGNNLNAYSPEEMAEMFNSKHIPDNIIFEQSFALLIHQMNTKSIF